MDFLSLVKRLAVETGTELEAKITSVDIPPATAYGETTEHRSRLVRWIQQAWTDIQEDQEQWDFMVQRGTMPLVTNQWVYDIKSIVDADPTIEPYKYAELVPFVAPRDIRYVWVVDGSSSQLNRHICYYVPPERFRGHVDRFNDRSTGIPSRYTIRRDGCIEFDSKPQNDDLYLSFDFRVEPHQMLINVDEPRDLPEKFHEVIVYKAMMFHAMFDESQFQVQRSTKLYRDKMNKLRMEQLREYSLSGAMT